VEAADAQEAVDAIEIRSTIDVSMLEGEVDSF